jgi:hypothetical protein
MAQKCEVCREKDIKSIFSSKAIVLAGFERCAEVGFPSDDIFVEAVQFRFGMPITVVMTACL